MMKYDLKKVKLFVEKNEDQQVREMMISVVDSDHWQMDFGPRGPLGETRSLDINTQCDQRPFSNTPMGQRPGEF